MNGRAAPPLWEPAGRTPDDPALDDGRRRRTWGELEARTNALGRVLEGLGARPGDHVALVATNRVEFVEAALAASRAGLVYTPLKTSWTAGEIGYVLDTAGTRVVVTDVDAARAAAADRAVPTVDLDAGADDLVASADPGPLPYDRRGWKMSFTSGTTGRPKGVVPAGSGSRPFAESWAAMRAMAETVHLPGDGEHLFVSQLFHGAPLTFGLGVLARGARLRIMARWDAAEGLRLLGRPGVTSTCMVPTMFRQLLALPDEVRAAFRAPDLRTVLHGGEPCPQALKRAVVGWLGPVVVEYYGFTEGGMCVATTAEWLARPGTVGRPCWGQEAVALGPGGEELPAGTDGVLHFRRPDGSTFSYLDDEERTAAAHAGERFTVGDVGHVDADGYVYVTGRQAELIVTAGVNVSPVEVEEALAGVDGVADLCVVGGPDPERGEQVVAYVVPAEPGDAERLLGALAAAAAEHLAGYKRPRAWHVVDALPRDPTGKLLRRALRDPLWEGRDHFAV